MAGATRTVAVALVAKMQGFRSGLAEGSRDAKAFGGELEGMRKRSTASLHDVEMAAGAAGAALLGLAGWAVKVNMEFDKQMSEVQAVSGATAAELGELRDAALEAGKSTIFSATDAARAESELAKAGLSTSDILGGALSGALSLAAAGSLDLAEAADVAAKAMNTFGLEGADVQHIADQLAGGANATATDVHELGQALKMGGLAAHAAGMSLDDTVTVLGALADHALVGSDAGTSLKTMLMMLQAPTEKSANLMKSLGLEVYDANGNMVDAYTLADRLKQTLGGLTQAERNAAIATMFGADAMRGANILVNLGSEGLQEYNRRIGEQADAAATAATKTDNLAGDLERLKGSIETLAIESGEGANGGLRFLAQTLDHLVSGFGALPAPVQSAAVILAGLTGAALLGAVAFSKLRTAVRDSLEAIASTGPAGARASSALGRTMVVVGKATAAFAALQVASALVGAAMGDLRPQLDATTKGLELWAGNGDMAGEAARLFGAGAEELGGALEKLIRPGFGSDFAKWSDDVAEGLGFGGLLGLDEARQRVGAFDEALAQMVKNGNAELAARAIETVAARAGISAEQLKSLLPAYGAALETATTGGKFFGEAAGKAAQKAHDLADGFGDAAGEGDGLLTVFDELNGAFLTWTGAEIGAEEALDRLQEALKESGGSLDVHTEKGRTARRALLDYAKSTAEAMQAKMDESGSTKEAMVTYQHYRDELIRTMVQTGLTRKEAEGLADEWLRMPKTVTTTVTTKYKTQGSPPPGMQIKYRNVTELADGGILEAYAAGGLRENHVAQFASGGAWRMWAEPETGGEAYIPLAASKRGRSTAILAEVNQRFGNPLGGGPAGQIVVTIPVMLLDPMTGDVTRRALIRRAVNAGVPEQTAREAYP